MVKFMLHILYPSKKKKQECLLSQNINSYGSHRNLQKPISFVISWTYPFWSEILISLPKLVTVLLS